MRVMVLIKATADSESGAMPSAELIRDMGKYNKKLMDAGVMLDGAGLKPSSKGKRMHFDGPEREVEDGPFAQTGELVSGYWMWKVKDMAEAVEWLKQCPNPMLGPSSVEIREVFEPEDFVNP